MKKLYVLATLLIPSVGLSNGDDPTEVISEEDLTKLLQRGMTPPNCTDPVVAVHGEPSTREAVRTWPIHSAGIGKLSADGPLPSWLLKREEKTLQALLNEGVPPDHYTAMEQGYVDQDGYRIISLQTLDLQIRYSNQNRVMVLYPGQTVRTAEGTGLGSTLGELLGAHGGFTMTNWPEPYHCGVHVQGYDGVSFAFTSCEEACAGAKVQRVTVQGKDPWGEGSANNKTTKEK